MIWLALGPDIEGQRLPNVRDTAQSVEQQPA
jgi:hypothetical protein